MEMKRGVVRGRKRRGRKRKKEEGYEEKKAMKGEMER